MDYKCVAEVARELGLKYNTMKYWALTDRIPRPHPIGWSKVYSTEEVERIKDYARTRQSR